MSALLNNNNTPKTIELIMDGEDQPIQTRFLVFGLVIQNDTDQPVTITGDRPDQEWICEAGQTYIGAIDTPSTVYTARSAGPKSGGICLMMLYSERIISGGQSNVVTRPNSNTTVQTVTPALELRIILSRPSSFVTVIIEPDIGPGEFNAAIYLPPVSGITGPRLGIALDVEIPSLNTNTDVPPFTWSRPVPAKSMIRVWGTCTGRVTVMY